MLRGRGGGLEREFQGNGKKNLGIFLIFERKRKIAIKRRSYLMMRAILCPSFNTENFKTSAMRIVVLPL